MNEHSTSQSPAPAVAKFMDLVEQRKARIGILGLGYVGIPLALRFHEVGYPVLGFDIDDQRIADLNAGESPIKHIPSKDIAAMAAGGFEATSDFSRIGEVEAIIICVPTPLSRHREPDLSYIVETMKAITPHLRAGQMLSLESTTWPGTTEEVLRPFIDGRGFTIGDDFFLVYSPEREDPGNPNFSTHSIPKVVGGSTAACRQVGERLYSVAVDKIVPVSSTQAAELTKLLENIHRAVNIGLVNEMKIIADKMDIDIFEVIDAAKTKPFGFTAYYPGPGLGGHCIPIDPFYLTWKAKEYGVSTHFIELAGEINRDMPQWVVAKIADALNDRQKSLKGSRILALGIAYKRDVDDMRESPSVLVMELLRDRGAIVEYSDPNVPIFPRMREHKFELSSIDPTPEVLESYDAAILLTDHSDFDYATILKHSNLVVDTRGKYREEHPNVIKA
ncbi:UDP-N-acetyl-D-glucosamine 6-dehydrogenase [Brevundimonas denitrificans]|uniref:UDP-N-acetyl-D-glucosamine 6-dehydrogenase n=1 Tax=Brevundimonas denitrificans TaxID=1443434 RepID=A0ABQ6BGK3_9CAUL|nr:nucleotide sugar dehydrogenase [Brevundimonas denitrificans]GLS00170.1 UDP-N-acetyl-D-glucosamine 6-dehydrogenase [Brevundimonas denitrificans]